MVIYFICFWVQHHSSLTFLLLFKSVDTLYTDDRLDNWNVDNGTPPWWTIEKAKEHRTGAAIQSKAKGVISKVQNVYNVLYKKLLATGMPSGK